MCTKRPRSSIQNSARSCFPARKPSRIRSTTSTLDGGWQNWTLRPMIARLREKTRSFPWVKKRTVSSLSTKVMSTGTVLRSAVSSGRLKLPEGSRIRCPSRSAACASTMPGGRHASTGSYRQNPISGLWRAISHHSSTASVSRHIGRRMFSSL